MTGVAAGRIAKTPAMEPASNLPAKDVVRGDNRVKKACLNFI